MIRKYAFGWEIQCDACCMEVEKTFMSWEDAANWAIEAGWVEEDNKKWVCPGCLEAEEDDDTIVCTFCGAVEDDSFDYDRGMCSTCQEDPLLLDELRRERLYGL